MAYMILHTCTVLYDWSTSTSWVFGVVSSRADFELMLDLKLVVMYRSTTFGTSIWF